MRRISDMRIVRPRGFGLKNGTLARTGVLLVPERRSLHFPGNNTSDQSSAETPSGRSKCRGQARTGSGFPAR